jgi:hypothetical protein
MHSPRTISTVIGTLACTLLLAGNFVSAQDAVQLIDSKEPAKEWSFYNGQEFKGATGGLDVDAADARDGSPTLKLTGDFSAGGLYVQMGRKLNVDIQEISMWLRSPDTDRMTLRINDGSNQTHQIAFKIEKSADWQHFVFPLERFFAKRGTAEAVTSIAKYESWNGAKDGSWHGPAHGLYIVIGKPGDTKVCRLSVNNVTITPPPPKAPEVLTRKIVELDELRGSEHDWRFSNGQEFPGASGALTASADDAAPGKRTLMLSGDFTKGGRYCAAVRDLTELDAKDLIAIKMQIKSSNTSVIGIQMVDGSGQTHQQSNTKIEGDGQWHELVLNPRKVAGGEHWAGKNDGKWHSPPRMLAISVKPTDESKQPVVQLAEVRAEILQAVVAQPASYSEDFENGAAVPPNWQTVGGVSVDMASASSGKASLLLSRTLEKIDDPCSAAGPSFPVVAGQWEFALACKSELESPDSSYSGVVTLQCLNAAQAVVETFTLADVFGKHDWTTTRKRVEIPRGAVAARFQAQLNKTHGSFWVDALSAAYMAPASAKGAVSRLIFSSPQLSNMLLPEDKRVFEVSVETSKPLRDSQRVARCVVRDYWGAEQSDALEVSLKDGKKPGTYEGSLDLSAVPLEIGRYYEIHGEVPEVVGEPFRNYTSFAILPEATTKKYKPEEIPFTARSWDNRIPDYIRLSDRLGVRVCGIWGGWKSKAPYEAEAPSLDLAKELGMGWLTNTPCATIERGKRDYSDEALRQGVRNLIEKFGAHRPFYINLGNEPHGTGQKVLDNVAAYKVVYEEIKKVDPTIPVIATSVEPNDEYFKAGYGQWCDAFDFHIYETSNDVRRTLGEYKALCEKYNCVKPIWSTELGLNSQGMTRQVVAAEVFKKFSVFFAAGGVNVSWFGVMYPDPEGKSAGSSGDSHNVFDCRFRHYAPRLDAVAVYNGINAIAIKKFVEEKNYDGTQDILFRDRDNKSLQFLWREKGRADLFVPLDGVQRVEIIRVDGRRRTLEAGGKGITLSVDKDPILLLYEGGGALPAELTRPEIALRNAPEAIKRNGETLLSVKQSEAIKSLELLAPPKWTVRRTNGTPDADGNAVVTFSVVPPVESAVREADLILKAGPADDRSSAELYFHAPIEK